MRRFLLILTFFCLGARNGPAMEIPKPLYVFDSESTYDFRHNFTVAVVRAALAVGERREGVVDVRLTNEADLQMNPARAMALIEQNKDQVHIMSREASQELDDRLLAIPISLAGSLLGERIFLMRPERRQEMDGIQTLEQLKAYTIGVNGDWVDEKVLKAAGFRTQSSASYELLFSMLRGRRYDLLSRGLHEAWDELRLRAFKDLDWQAGLILSYPVPYYLYINKQQTELAERLTQGLRVLEANGTLDNMLVEHFGPGLLRANCLGRQRIAIKNPDLPRRVPAPFKTWEAWHQAAQLKLTHWCQRARDQFQPTWSGLYRPKRLIASARGLAGIHSSHIKDSGGLFVRSADGVKDTHILSGVFALELALAQPINRHSPYFQRPVVHVIDSKLDQRSALQKLNQDFQPLDAVITQGSLERRKKWESARFDMAQGLMGLRVLVIRKTEATLFEKVQTVKDLKRHRLCVGSTWPDRKVLEEAGIPILAQPRTEDLYAALERGQCAGVLLAAFEARDQILARPHRAFLMDPHLLLNYPASQQLFVHEKEEELVHAAERGLGVLKRTGVLGELLDVLYGDSLMYARVDQRRVIHLVNPDFPELFVQDRLKLVQPLQSSAQLP